MNPLGKRHLMPMSVFALAALTMLGYHLHSFHTPPSAFPSINENQALQLTLHDCAIQDMILTHVSAPQYYPNFWRISPNSAPHPVWYVHCSDGQQSMYLIFDAITGGLVFLHLDRLRSQVGPGGRMTTPGEAAKGGYQAICSMNILTNGGSMRLLHTPVLNRKWLYWESAWLAETSSSRLKIHIAQAERGKGILWVIVHGLRRNPISKPSISNKSI